MLAIAIFISVKCSSLIWRFTTAKVITRMHVQGLCVGIQPSDTLIFDILLLTTEFIILTISYKFCGLFGSPFISYITIIFFLIFSLAGYLMSFYCTRILDKTAVLRNIILSYCRAIKKMQLSLSGRELLHPLPPINRLEVYILSQYDIKDQRIAMSAARVALSTSMLLVRANLLKAGDELYRGQRELRNPVIDNASHCQSPKNWRSTSMLQAIGEDTLNRLLPQILELHIHTWNGHYLKTHEKIVLCEVWKDFCKMWQSLVHLSNFNSVLDSALIELDLLNHSSSRMSGGDVKYFDQLNNVGSSSYRDHTDTRVADNLINIRTKMATLKMQLEDALARIFLCEEELAKVSVPLLSYSQQGRSNCEDTSAAGLLLKEASLTRGDMSEILESCRNALSLLRGKGLVSTTIDHDTRLWNVPSSEQLTESVSTLSEFVGLLEEQLSYYASSNASETQQCVSLRQACDERTSIGKENKYTKMSGSTADYTGHLAGHDQSHPPPILEPTSFGDDESRQQWHLGTLSSPTDKSYADLPIDILTADVLSDAEIKVMNDHMVERTTQLFAEHMKISVLSRKLVTELGQQMILANGCRAEVERPLHDSLPGAIQSLSACDFDRKEAVADISDKQTTSPLLHTEETLFPQHVQQVSSNPSPCGTASFGLRSELSSVLAAVSEHRKHFIHGDSSSDSESEDNS